MARGCTDPPAGGLKTVWRILEIDTAATDRASARNGAVARSLVRLALGLTALVAGGNLALVVLSWWARSTRGSAEHIAVGGVDKASVVDQRVWRGAGPTATGYARLAEAGVTTVVDLRNDDERGSAVDALADLGIRVVRIPIRDGQTPTDRDISRFLDVVASSEGIVFLHCGAGVGRTGAMAAAYLAREHAATGLDVARRSLAIGPPSLEQLAFALAGGEPPPLVVTAVSRLLDAPRRIWHASKKAFRR
jgi:protein tyrosine phosphatase (PTP) superfamily phosphohydrolase (DUF442 family)